MISFFHNKYLIFWRLEVINMLTDNLRINGEKSYKSVENA